MNAGADQVVFSGNAQPAIRSSTPSTSLALGLLTWSLPNSVSIPESRLTVAG